MSESLDNDQRDAPAPRSRRARLHSLLFASAALGTSLLTVLGEDAVKLPPFRGE